MDSPVSPSRFSIDGDDGARFVDLLADNAIKFDELSTFPSFIFRNSPTDSLDNDAIKRENVLSDSEFSVVAHNPVLFTFENTSVSNLTMLLPSSGREQRKGEATLGP
jgi:hypothetical protein